MILPTETNAIIRCETYRKMNTENVHCCVWLLMMMAEYEQVVSRWE